MKNEQEILKKYFNHNRDAVMIFQDDHLLLNNLTAQKLITEFKLDPGYLQEVVKNARQDKQKSGENNQTNDLTIPFTLENKKDDAAEYSLTYQLLDGKLNIYFLALRNRDDLKKVDQLDLQKKLTQYVNQAHEEERKRISQDLHDSIAQGVYSAIRGIRRLNQANLTKDERQYLCKMIEIQLDDTLTEVKNMALDIRPAVLDSFGLEAAIKALVKREQENSGVEIDFVSHTGKIKLSKRMQSVLYRITQEAINNALKHANPTEISVMLVVHDHFIKLDIIDNGCGFKYQPKKGFNGHSMGLMNMDERVRSLNGRFNIQSKLGEGTTVSASFPLINQKIRNQG